MDPVSAFGIASNVVQFIAFAASLTKGVIEIRESGSLKSVRQLSEVTASLEEWNAKLRDDADQCHLDDSLKASLKGCSEVASRMAISLQKVQTSTSSDRKRASSIELFLRTAWKAAEREELRQHLNDYRLEINTYLTVLLFSNVTNIGAQKGPTTTAQSVQAPSVQVPSIATQLSSNQRDDWFPFFQAAYDKGRVDFTQFHSRVLRILGDTDVSKTEAVDREVLASLEFPEMSRRPDAIKEAHGKTFNWIFEKPTGFSSFSDWLLSKEKLYWLTGKAGSGKSTLMKYILLDRRTRAITANQAHGKRLIIASFFFWNAGTALQTSQEGLVRTLLYQCLSASSLDGFFASVVPARWDHQRLLGWPVRDWTWEEMVNCLHRFLDATRDTHNILFLIDGLDEFVGDHSDLIELVRTFSCWSHVKTCVSSRPWMTFEDAYQRKPSLRMEQLTHSDILQFVSDKLSIENPAFLDLQQAEPESAAGLVNNLVERSSGVFLWVSLVTKELLRGLARGEKLSGLNALLDSLPTDLEALFRKMMALDDPTLAQKASRMIQLVQLPSSLGVNEFLETKHDPLSLLDLAFADEDFDILEHSHGTFESARKMGMARRVFRRLDDACRGLVEIQSRPHSPNCRYDYLHRTVKDYILRRDIWAKILEATPPGFNAAASWAQTFIMRLKLNMADPDGPSNAGRQEANLHLSCFMSKHAELAGWPYVDQLLGELRKSNRIVWSLRGSFVQNKDKQADAELFEVALVNQLARYVKGNWESQSIDTTKLQEYWFLALRPSECKVGGHASSRPTHKCRAEMAEVLLDKGAHIRWRWRDRQGNVIDSSIWDIKEVDDAHAKEMESLSRRRQVMPKPFSKPRYRFRFSIR